LIRSFRWPSVGLWANQVVSETFDALITLGHSEADARKLIDEAMISGKKFKDTESLLTAIYQRGG